MANTLLNGPGETPAQNVENVGKGGPGRYEAFGYRLAEDGTIEAKVFVVAVTHGASLPEGWFDHPDKCKPVPDAAKQAPSPLDDAIQVSGGMVDGVEGFVAGDVAAVARRGRPPGSKNKAKPDAEPVE